MCIFQVIWLYFNNLWFPLFFLWTFLTQLYFYDGNLLLFNINVIKKWNNNITLIISHINHVVFHLPDRFYNFCMVMCIDIYLLCLGMPRIKNIAFPISISYIGDFNQFVMIIMWSKPILDRHEQFTYIHTDFCLRFVLMIGKSEMKQTVLKLEEYFL